MTEPFIRISSVVKRYGEFRALDNVSLDIPQGEFLALLGPSGCGKTTLLRSIAGFTEITSGDILLEGQSIQRIPPNRRPVNTVFQNYALFPHLTVVDNVAYGPRRAGKTRAQSVDVAERCLGIVGMADFAGRYPSMLSGGQQQRVALARAIANEPKVLLLDEPLGALDLKLRKQMQMELKTLHESLRTTFIFVTHDQEEALVMADRIAVMGTGRIAQVGTGEEIYNTPTESYVADFVGDANLLQCTVEGAGMLRTAAGVQIAAQDDAGSGKSVWYLIRPEDIRVGPVSPDAAPGPVIERARIRETAFIGNARRLFLETPEGERFVALTAGAADYAPGAEVTLSWPADRARVLAR